MSLIPERHICPECGGYDLTGMGQLGRNLSSRCKCGEDLRAGEVRRARDFVGVIDNLLERSAAS
jgi:hypothetical protein